MIMHEEEIHHEHFAFPPELCQSVCKSMFLPFKGVWKSSKLSFYAAP